MEIGVPSSCSAEAGAGAEAASGEDGDKGDKGGVEAERVEDVETRPLFAEYNGFLDGPPHPTQLYTSSTLLLSMRRPNHAFVHPRLADGGVISAPQLDSVALASERAEKGRALLIADATGAGKGRQLVAFLVNCWLRAGGAGRLVYVTASNTLLADLRRDMSNATGAWIRHRLASPRHTA